MIGVYKYTDTEAQFVELMNRYRRLIFSIINKYAFIKEQEKEDYYQEVVCFLWERFERFDHTKGGFAVWMYQNAEWAILTYRRKIRWYSEKVTFSDSIVSWYDAADDEYDESNIQQLQKIISELSPNHQRIVRMFLEGENLAQRSLEDGKCATAYSSTLHAIRKRILSQHGKSFEQIAIDPRKTIVVPNGRTNELHVNSRPVEMRDMNGAFIKSFPSASEAHRNGFNASMVVAVARGKRYSYKGYKWNYVGGSVDRKPMQSGRAKIAVLQKRITGEIVARFSCLSECKEAGFNPDSISKNIKGKTKEYRGYVWVRESESIAV
ncbi:sigma-70 family RNA polymerase sigma factor [Chitinophaga cymbidii]|uniref:RNA polymerase sigma-70 region 2 domain-containing protein n=1 Tax=Chitinophaga cymbidii TaxID=1096750 RepID=A0A512RIT6_9BACT|nr:sigma-70 family RNA polymerase sigma factor [Chitinophaga cymbidii]GEP95574.1 hypothetical protein CCY01nite_18340 [Chitinophaga cymbidii]